MRFTLGIHVGHDAACAIVADGSLVAATQQERFSRRKHDGQLAFGNRLPVRACLRAAGVTLKEVTRIVSSLQAASHGGFGLHAPLIESDFNLFDPWDSRHFVVSHHLAHAASSWFASPFRDAAVLVCDQAGSSTPDGEDFAVPFSEWYQDLISAHSSCELKTECLSIYSGADANLVLKERDYVVPHNAPESFVQSPASLYENVSRRIFGREQAYGETMALAAYGEAESMPPEEITGANLVTVEESDEVVFRNDWQHGVRWDGTSPRDYSALARACQEATEVAVLAYARRARLRTGSRFLCLAGGTFLNILANSRLWSEGGFAGIFVPSAPHDSGVAVGAAYLGDGMTSQASHWRSCRASDDYLGITYAPRDIEAAISEYSHLIDARSTSPDDVAGALAGGALVGRLAGRSEFGPRALGHRSLLGSPLLRSTKDRLNTLKGRQKWRPVAPVVPLERFSDFFAGPPESPYMSFAHTIRREHRAALAALDHPDGTTRAQTLERSTDGELHSIIESFGNLTGYPILVNTSLNGPGQPILETPKEALQFLVENEDVDYLLLENRLIVRLEPFESQTLSDASLSLAPRCLGHTIPAGPSGKRFLSLDSATVPLSEAAYEIAVDLGAGKYGHEVLEMSDGEGAEVTKELYQLICLGFVEVRPAPVPRV